MQRTFNSKDETSEYGRMVEMRVPVDPSWGLPREEYSARQRHQILSNITILSMEHGTHLTMVLTPC